jgi:hypothetical protein
VAEPTPALASSLLQASAQVAGLCDAIDHLELAEVAGLRSGAEALARAAVVSWIGQAPVEDLADDLLARTERRRARYAPAGAARGVSTPVPPVGTWEGLRAHLEWSDGLSDLDFMGRDRPAQLRHLSYSFPQLAAKLADPARDQAALAPQCVMLALRLTSVCRARFDDAPVAEPPTVRR